MSLWAIARAPLMLGAVLPLDSSDSLTLQLLSNEAVLDVNANSCSNAPVPVLEPGNTTELYAWAAGTASGEAIVALFNAQEAPANVSAAAPGWPLSACVTNLWTGQVEGATLPGGIVRRELAPHSSGLWRVGAGSC